MAQSKNRAKAGHLQLKCKRKEVSHQATLLYNLKNYKKKNKLNPS